MFVSFLVLLLLLRSEKECVSYIFLPTLCISFVMPGGETKDDTFTVYGVDFLEVYTVGDSMNVFNIASCHQLTFIAFSPPIRREKLKLDSDVQEHKAQILNLWSFFLTQLCSVGVKVGKCTLQREDAKCDYFSPNGSPHWMNQLGAQWLS